MKEIICPNCNKAFKVDEAGFADILKQVRDHQFEEEIQARLHLAEKEKETAILLAEAKIKNALQERLAQKPWIHHRHQRSARSDQHDR